MFHMKELVQSIVDLVFGNEIFVQYESDKLKLHRRNRVELRKYEMLSLFIQINKIIHIAIMAGKIVM